LSVSIKWKKKTVVATTIDLWVKIDYEVVIKKNK